MANPRHSDGRRDLALIRASGSTARVLNLALVYERFGEAEDYSAQPLFQNVKLNRALIFKHTLRPHEADLFDRPEPHTTKIVFPYSATELGLGGTSVMIGERRFGQLLRGALGAAADTPEFESDFELLNHLHEMPSFDPFLLREQLRRLGRAPASCFFEISEADVAQMIAFVCNEIAPLTQLAFGASGRRGANLSMRMAEKLMTDENAKLLDPLRETLRLSQVEYVEGVFAWKGFLYYKWLLADFAVQHEAFQAKFINCEISRTDPRKRAEAEKLKFDVLAAMDRVARGAVDMVAEYSNAFSALTRGQPIAFREFLLQAPPNFVILGEAAGALKHINSYWGFRFPNGAAAKMEPDEALDVLQEFDVMLRGVELTLSRPAQDLLLN